MRHVLSQSGAPKYVKKTAPAASRFVTKVPRALRGVPLGPLCANPAKFSNLVGLRLGHALFDPGAPGFARGFPRFLPSFPYRHLAASHWDLFYVIVYILGYVRNKSES